MIARAPPPTSMFGWTGRPVRRSKIGVFPLRIDVLTDISGVPFDEALPRRSVADVAGVPANIIGLDDLIASTRAAARDKDLIDDTRLVRRRDEKR